jgi:hypothetical protein
MTQDLLHKIVENGDQVAEHRVYRKGSLSEDGPVTWTRVAALDGNAYVARGTITDRTGEARTGTARDTGKPLSGYVQYLNDRGHTRIAS